VDKPEDNNQASPLPPAADGAAPAVLSARRRLLRGGLMGAPVLLALKSSPVLACNCKLPSGFSVSGNLSRNAGKACADPGTKPSGWLGKTYTNSKGKTCYNSTSITTNTAFSTHFKLTGYSDKTFHSALGVSDTNDQALIVAVFLESIVSGGGTNFPNQTIVKNMWNLGVCGNGYAPVDSYPTIVWKKPQVLAYLRYLTGQT
jgi:hypothetical protein